jgi:hypothetical protein
MSRHVYLLGVGLALVALALAFTDWALSLRPGVTEANFRRVRPGMTLAEVEALLGGKAGRKAFLNHGEGYLGLWAGPDGTAHVVFSCFNAKEYTVLYSAFRRAGGASSLARLRAWLGW